MDYITELEKLSTQPFGGVIDRTFDQICNLGCSLPNDATPARRAVVSILNSFQSARTWQNVDPYVYHVTSESAWKKIRKDSVLKIFYHQDGRPNYTCNAIPAIYTSCYRPSPDTIKALALRAGEKQVVIRLKVDWRKQGRYRVLNRYFHVDGYFSVALGNILRGNNHITPNPFKLIEQEQNEIRWDGITFNTRIFIKNIAFIRLLCEIIAIHLKTSNFSLYDEKVLPSFLSKTGLLGTEAKIAEIGWHRMMVVIEPLWFRPSMLDYKEIIGFLPEYFGRDIVMISQYWEYLFTIWLKHYYRIDELDRLCPLLIPSIWYGVTSKYLSNASGIAEGELTLAYESVMLYLLYEQAAELSSRESPVIGFSLEPNPYEGFVLLTRPCGPFESEVIHGEGETWVTNNPLMVKVDTAPVPENMIKFLDTTNLTGKFTIFKRSVEEQDLTCL